MDKNHGTCEQRYDLSVEERIENFFGIDAFSLHSMGGGRVPQSAS